MAALAAHPWPGNVRERQNVLANLTVTGPRYGPVGPGDLPAAFRTAAPAARQPPLAVVPEDIEREMVRNAFGPASQSRPPPPASRASPARGSRS